jgi:hypothetical protein
MIFDSPQFFYVQSSELSGREKVRAIEKALKQAKTGKASKVYVVTHKTGAGSVGTKTSASKVHPKFMGHCIICVLVHNTDCVGQA